MAAQIVASDGKGVLEDCTVRNMELVKTNIRNCTLHDVTLRDCQVFNSKLYDCKDLDSTISSSQFFNTKPREDCLQQSESNQPKPTTTSAFRKLPTELRELIFEQCLNLENQRIPALLAAVRGDTCLYEEAIDIFYKLNPFPLTYVTLQRCRELSDSAVSKIWTIHIDCDDLNELTRSPNFYGLPPRLIQLSKISEVLLHGRGIHPVDWWMRRVFHGLNVKKLTIVRRPGDIDLFWKIHLGIFRTHLKSIADATTPNQWTWSAPVGDFLKWFEGPFEYHGFVL